LYSPSNTLSGNRAHPVKNADGRDDGNHVLTYRAVDILSHDDIRLSQGGCILIGLLSGGDYHQAGVQGCGKLIAAALARCGFGDRLLEAASSLSCEELEKWLDTWRDEVREELRTNKSGLIGSKKPALAKKIPDDFPDVDILLSYTSPITSETEGKPTRDITWEQEPDIGKIAALCELYFEWGVKDVIIKRFRTVLWPSAVQRILRRGAMEKDEKKRKGLPLSPKKSKTTGKLAPGTPSKMITKYFSSMKLHSPTKDREEQQYSDTESEAEEDRLIVKIHSSRRHASTDGILEYRLEIAPAQLVQLAGDGVQGIRPPIEVDAAFDDTEGDDEDEDGGKQKGKSKGKKPPPDPESHLRVWMPACMVQIVEPELVEAFEDIQRRKLEKRTKRLNKTDGKKKAVFTAQGDSDGDALPVLAPAKKKPTRSKKVVAGREDMGLAPRSLPIIDTSDDPFEPKNTVHAKISRQSQTGSKKHTKSSDSDPPQSCITKSPRKSPQQTSPRSSGLTGIMGSTSYIQPMRKLNDIVDISNMTEREKNVSTAQSDSDEDALPPPKTTCRKKAVLEPQATALAPRPFPMSGFISTSDDPFMEPTNPIHAHMTQQSLQTCSKKYTKSSELSDSESFQPPVTKSPSKTPRRTSPRSSGLITRPNSPSLVRPIHEFDDIIEISSDSDVPLPPKKISVVAPLLLARAKAKKGDSLSHLKSKRPGLESTFKGQSTRVVMAENDIIDLTD
jgi:Holliday junction resolvase YEN1